jgi:HIV Tat-specific factor 1
VQLEEDDELMDDIHRDVLDDAETIGPVKNVVVYDLEPRGICVIRFRDSESAQKCADAWDGRRYNGRVVRAGVPTEAVKFKRSLKSRKEVDDEEERLAQFSRDLEADNGGL